MKSAVPLAAPESIRVYSSLLDCGDECSRLWHLLRGLDTAGSGRITINPKDIAAMMGISKATIYRHLSSRLWFRSVESVQGGVQIYLNSIYNVCDRLGLSGLGAITHVPLSGLGRAQAKAISTQAIAQAKQRQAYWAAKNQKVKRLVKPWEAVASDNSPGANKTGTPPRFRYIITKANVIPATSTQSIADGQWSVSTIKRRLQDNWRAGRGLGPILKARLLKPVGAAISFLVRQGGDRVSTLDGVPYRVMENGSVFQVGCHIYTEHLVLSSCRFLRSKVRKRLNESPTPGALKNLSQAGIPAQGMNK